VTDVQARPARARSTTGRENDGLLERAELHANEAHPEADVQSEQVEALVKSSD
jgi:hypothetical protein